MGFCRGLDSPTIVVIFALLFFDCFNFVHGESNGTQNDVTPINHDLYHTWEALLEEIESLVHRHPDRLSMEKISSRNLGYEAQMNVVTYCRNQKDCDSQEKLRILLSFGQHARELITTELALRLLSVLSGEEFLPDVNRSTFYDSLDRLVIKIVPVENLNGRKVVEDGQLCERRNGRGVDLNRNWSVDWGKKEKDYDPNEENPGSSPFSEPETQIMRKLSVSFEPHIWVNVHSGMEALFMPYDHKNTTPDGVPSQTMRSMLKQINHLHLNDHCLVGSGGGSVGYLAHGTATDYMYDVARIPMAFTFEIYGDPKASSKDCFKMFNPVEIATFNRVMNEWSAAFLHMFSIGARSIDKLESKDTNESSSSSGVGGFHNWVSIDDYLNGYLMQRRSRYGKKIEVLDLGVQEIRAYFRLFMLSSVLLIFMFCSRIIKNNRTRPVARR